MMQITETTDEEKFEIYNTLKKDVIIGMLIEANKHLQRLTPRVVVNDRCFYMAGTDTSCRCIHCGKTKWEHDQT